MTVKGGDGFPAMPVSSVHAFVRQTPMPRQSFVFCFATRQLNVQYFASPEYLVRSPVELCSVVCGL